MYARNATHLQHRMVPRRNDQAGLLLGLVDGWRHIGQWALRDHRHLLSVKGLPLAVGPRDMCLEQSSSACVAPQDEGDAIGQKTVRFCRDKQTRRMRLDQRVLDFEAVFAVKRRLIHEGSDCWLGVRGRPW